MRSLLSLILLSLALLVRGQAERPLGFVRLVGMVPADRPETYDGALVGTVLGPAAPRRLVGEEKGGLTPFAVQRVRVEDSRAFPRGTVVGGKLYFPEAFGYPGADAALTDPSRFGSLAVPVDDWRLYHTFTGEVHCGTAVRRTPLPTFRWWNP